MNPFDSALTPLGQTAWDDVARTGKHGLDYVQAAIADPARVGRDLKDAASRLNRDLNPTATPEADTAVGEWKRSFPIGMNEGELGYQVGSTLFGIPAIKGLTGIGTLSREAETARLMNEGFAPRTAANLSRPYDGIGAHFVPQRVLKRLGIPPVIGDSPFNVLKPRGISQGGHYKLHFETDPKLHGGPLPAGLESRGWSGKQLGWKRRGPLGRIWYGTPDALRASFAVPSLLGLADEAAKGQPSW
jgi:hypothetical protein